MKPPRITAPMWRALYRLAHMKYGWTYADGYSQITTFEALVRRQLASVVVERSGGLHMAYALTTSGRALVAELWPLCPFILGTYNVPVGGWTPYVPAEAAAA